MKSNILFFLFLTIVLTTFSCKEKESPAPYANSVIVTNEGNFGSSNGTITSYNRTTGVVGQAAFQSVNNFNLGDVVQSMTSFNDKSYICINQSAKVEVVNSETLETEGTIVDVPNPRYFLGVSSSKAYVSSWSFGAGSELSVIDLPSYEKNSVLITGWVEEMLLFDNKAYVTVSDTNEVLVVSTDQDIITGKFTTGFGPTSIVQGNNDQIYVLFSGKKIYNPDFSLNLAASTAGGITQIDPASQSIVQEITFSDVASTPSKLRLSLDKTKLLYLYQGAVYSLEGTTIAPYIANTSRNFYGLDVDPTNGDIYVSDALDFNQAGDVYRYNAAGDELATFKAGIIPGGFRF